MLLRHRAATHVSATLSASTLSPLHLLRYYFHTRPGARRALSKTVGFGGASWIGLSLSTPVRIEAREASSMAAEHDEEMRGRTQQAPLASQRDAQSQQGRIAKWFPLSAKEGFSQWWAGTSTMATEHRVLSFIPHLQKPPTQTQSGSAPASAMPSAVDLTLPPRTSEAHETTSSLTDPYGPRRWNSEMVVLSGKDRALNEFSVERVGEQVDESLVMLHGYGAGLGFFYRNFEALSRAEGWKVYALDLLGMGRSSRPTFKIRAKDKQGKITEAEDWFIDALEEWRIKRGLEKFTLLGHSLGGYLACCYALKYPGRLNKLILASPVGIPEDPFAVNDALPEPQDSTLNAEFTQDAASTTGNNTNTSKQPPPSDPPRRRLPSWFAYLWEANVLSPFAFIRWSGPIGPRLVSGWTTRRFSHLPEAEAAALHDYSYSIFRQRGSSEYALGYLLAPGAYARSPLIRRIQGVGRQWIGERGANGDVGGEATTAETERGAQRENGIPIVFMYGEVDWMDVAGGFAAEEKIKQERERVLAHASVEERNRDNGGSKVVIINKAGHHVYLDGWEQFNQVMLEEMADVKRRVAEAKKAGR